jgi:hypothetical protein
MYSRSVIKSLTAQPLLHRHTVGEQPITLTSVKLTAKAENLDLAQKFTIMRIATLRTTSEMASDSLSEAFGTAVDATSSAMEAFIGADFELYQDFSNIEWTRLIHVVINIFRLLSIALTHPAQDHTAHQLALFDSRFERLSNRMKEGLWNNNELKRDPNIFLLFDSILPVLRVKYSTMISKLQAMDTFHQAPSGPPSSLASLCPVFNGTVKNTEYWDALTAANNNNFGFTERVSFDDEFWTTGLGSFDDFSLFENEN